MKTLIFLIFFLLLAAFFIISEKEIKLNNTTNINLFFKTYFAWIDELTTNGKSVSAYVLKMEWLPDKS